MFEFYQGKRSLQISVNRRIDSDSDGVTIPLQRCSHSGRTALPPDMGYHVPDSPSRVR